MTIGQSIKTEDVVADNNDSIVSFRSALSEFRFSPEKSESTLRRSQRRRRSVAKCESEHVLNSGGDDDVLPAPRKTSRKRSASQAGNTGVKQEVGASPKKKPKRGYAPPETYAHLATLNDYLAPGLDGARTACTLFGPVLTQVSISILIHVGRAPPQSYSVA